MRQSSSNLNWWCVSLLATAISIVCIKTLNLKSIKTKPTVDHNSISCPPIHQLQTQPLIQGIISTTNPTIGYQFNFISTVCIITKQFQFNSIQFKHFSSRYQSTFHRDAVQRHQLSIASNLNKADFFVKNQLKQLLTAARFHYITAANLERSNCLSDIHQHFMKLKATFNILATVNLPNFKHIE